MLDFLKNAVNTLAGPMATVVDFAGDKLGLPPLLTNSIKAAAGVMTGNVMMATSGAMGIVSELMKNPAAQTEFYPAQDAAKAQEGYAPATAHAASTASTGRLDPSVLKYKEALQTLAANFGVLDTLCGKQDSKIDLQTLQVASQHPNLSPELRSAARFLVEHPEYRNVLDTAGKGGSVDGTISQRDVQQALKKVMTDIAQYGVRQPPTPGGPGKPGTPVESKPPATGQPAPPVESAPPIVPAPKPAESSGASGSVSDIINNPHMSMEEKLQALLTLITQDTDAEILGVMKEMSSARDERAKLGTDDASRTRSAKLETTMEQLNLRLQKLMEKRKQMFDLMSNISSKFNEMAKQAIQNLGRA